MSPQDREGIPFRAQVLMAFNSALLGEVTSDLNAVTVRWSESEIEGIFYYDGVPTNENKDRVDEIETQIIAAFPSHTVRLVTAGLGKGEDPAPLTEWVFLRTPE